MASLTYRNCRKPNLLQRTVYFDEHCVFTSLFQRLCSYIVRLVIYINLRVVMVQIDFNRKLYTCNFQTYDKRMTKSILN